VRPIRLLSVAVAAALLLTHLAVAGAAPKVKSLGQGQPFCPARTIVNNKVVVKHGACYTLFVMRQTKRTYLAFASKNAKIRPGQVVRLDTAAGAKLRKQVRYLVPIKTSEAIVPQNSIAMVAAKVEDHGARLSLTILGTPAQNLTVMFRVRRPSASAP
jgi:hypothetical protein